MLYCKFCASKLEAANVTKCPVCAARIDLLDGGQTYFEESDLYLWSLKDDDLQQTMPKTQILGTSSDDKRKSVKSQNGQTYVKTCGKQEKAYKPASGAAMIKLILVGIAVLLAVALVSIVAFKFVAKNRDDNEIVSPEEVVDTNALSQKTNEGDVAVGPETELEDLLQNLQQNEVTDKKEENASDENSENAKDSERGYPDKDKLPDKIQFTLSASDNQGRMYKKNDSEPMVSAMVKEPELGFLSFGKGKIFFVSINDFEDLIFDKSSGIYERIEDAVTGEYVFPKYESDTELVVVIGKKDGENVAETSNEKVKLVEDKHFAVNERGLHFFELGFLCDYLGYDWDVKLVKDDEKNNSENIFDITLKKKK